MEHNPSMKCREMNPGNESRAGYAGIRGDPSMKCREMNPGNNGSKFVAYSLVAALNEVPGDESRQ